MKEKESRHGLFVIFTLIFFFSFALVMGYTGSIFYNIDLEKQCNKYEVEYGLNTKIVGNKFLWDGSFDCKIITKSGIEISYSDFKIASVYDFGVD